MKKEPIVVAKLLVLLICFTSLLSCKNGDKNADGLFTTEEDFTPTTAAELEEEWNAVSSKSLKFPKQVEEFYQSRSYAPAWTDKELISAFVEELGNAKAEGLSSVDYYSQRLQKLLNSSVERTGEDRAALEILLTDSFFTYARDLFYGKLDPKELYSLWGLQRDDLDLNRLLQKALENREITAALESLKPSHPVYSGLKESLREYEILKEKDTAVTKITEGKSISPGEKDERTPKLAKRLRELGYLQQDSISHDSVYGKALVNAIKTFQEDKGLQPDGIIGNSTLRELNMDNSQLYNKILVNLERWRWYPRDLGDHYILVNVADFKLTVVKDGDTIRQHNVIAGSSARPTPVFTDTLEYIVINPVWNIPPTIEREDIIPKASRNPSYLRNNNISVTAPNGDRLDPWSIDWSDPEVKKYRFSQSAGPSNPLGRVKIIYPNRYLIYLHDTPSKALFTRNDRAESSGCVRVENAIDLAAYVVEDQGDWNLEQIKETIASGKTKQVKITRPIQVHHFYWTAWRGLGETYFADDVYNLDERIYKALTQTP